MMTREQALKELLQPITWNPTSSVATRRDLVRCRRRAVGVVMPFLTEDEQKQVGEWVIKEAHDGLWD